MSSFAQSVRFLAGMGLLAGGAILVHPLAEGLLRKPAPAAAEPPAAAAAAPDAAATPFGGPGNDGWSVGPAAFGGGPAVPPAPPPLPAADAAGGPALPSVPYVPPPVPAPLPRADVMAVAPDLAFAYRSTVDIPPPPLLDTQSPPPLGLTWETHGGPRPLVAADVAAIAAAPTAPATGDAWGTRVVRDGDDLTSIALEVYGHAAAAAALREANADVISDPQLLPIGLVLRLPPSWTLPSSPATRPGGQPPIEPSKGAAAARVGRGEPLPGGEAGPGGDSAAWLAAPVPAAAPLAAAPAVAAPLEPAAAAAPPSPGPPARPASVRAAPGDTLDAIAERFYGDRSMARQIWLANRDRLRSPALVVPGMELNLP
jgi:nucleoid-associated protein YgaU